MTYSIIARDPETGQFGAAVQTCNLAVGTWVPWAAGGVGVIATQAVAERRYGTSGLDLMRGGYTAVQTLQALLAADPKQNHRQVSMIDKAGNVATYTGDCCLPAAGSFVGDTFCTQANMVARETVWPAMAKAYETAVGTLAERLLAALDAAQAEGGDIRGQQTAALLIVGSQPSPTPLIDLRVDHDPNPVLQLRRLLQLHQAYRLEYEIVEAIEQGQTESIYEMITQVGQLAPDEPYLQCLRALHLERELGLHEEALAILHPLIEQQPQWRSYLERELEIAQNSHCSDLDLQLLRDLDRRQKNSKESEE